MAIERRGSDAARPPAWVPASATLDLLIGAARREFKPEGVGVERPIGPRRLSPRSATAAPLDPALASGKGA
jgi:hypothetical protein